VAAAIALTAICASYGLALARGGTIEVLWLAGGVALAGLVIVATLGFDALLVWGAVTAAAYPFVRLPSDDVLVTFDRAWVGALLVVLLVVPRARPLSRTTKLVLLTLTWLVVAYGVRAATTPVETPNAVRTWLDGIVLPAVLFLVVARLATTEERVVRLLGALALGGGALGLLGIGQKVLGFDLASLTGGEIRYDQNVGVVRISGPYPVPETYVLATTLTLAATLCWMQIRGSAALMLGSALAGIQVLAIGLTFFRAGWICALIVVIAAFGLRPRRYGRLIGVVAAIAAVTFVSYGQLQQDSAVSARVQNTDNLKSRIASYSEGIALFRDEPVFGVGVNQFPAAAAAKPRASFQGVNAEHNPHSSYVAQLAEQGIWGLVPLLAVTGAVWLLLRRYRRRARSRLDVILAAGAVGGALAYLLMSATLTMLPYSPSNLFFAALLGVVAARLDVLARRGAAPA
ncbi:MAG: O-antigen ligase family protein, partial [Actinomycetota bacterium]|nr:O-antigen ligase family protein [Actinomycetota bacterium]